MMYPDTNGTHVRIMPRTTMIPPAPHPDGHGACSERNLCDACAAAYAIEDDRDTVEDASDAR